AVVAAAAVEVVVAGPAVDRIGAVVAAQAVVLGRTVEILDGDQRVAGGDAGVDARVCQVDTDANVAFAVVGGIGTRAAIQDVLVRAAEQYVVAALAVDPVVAPAAEQPIVAGAALDHVCAVAAAQVVGKSGPDNVLHAGKAVAEGLAEVQRRVEEIHPHTAARVLVGHRVGPAAAVQHVPPGPAVQRVVATPAQQAVVAAPAPQVVVRRVPRHAVVAAAGEHPLDTLEDDIERRAGVDVGV